jgi:hypothetical protein
MFQSCSAAAMQAFFIKIQHGTIVLRSSITSEAVCMLAEHMLCVGLRGCLHCN